MCRVSVVLSPVVVPRPDDVFVITCVCEDVVGVAHGGKAVKRQLTVPLD
jgi:hypothetical protein